jgi:clathrin heavy chain
VQLLSAGQTLESDRYICVREKSDEASAQVVIIDLHNSNNVTRRTIKADSAIMHWSKNIIALKAQRTLQIFDLDAKGKLKSHAMNEDVVFWKWISERALGLITDTSVYHWDILDPAQTAPVKMFDRHVNLQVRRVPKLCAALEI